jgi:hypothetical protein
MQDPTSSTPPTVPQPPIQISVSVGSKLKAYLYIGLAIAVLICGVWVYGMWRDYQILKSEHQISLQNQKALGDSISVQAAKITVITSEVRDLKAENADLKGKNVALQVKNKILVDSIKILGKSTATITDSSVRVPFSGQKNIFHFDGWTLANLRHLELSTWELNGHFDPINTKSVLFKDVDGFWKLKSMSLTEGIILRGTSDLDDDTFNALQKYSPPAPLNHFGLNVQANTKDFYGGIIFRYDERWYLNLDYRFMNAQSQWFDNMLVGVSYFLF